MTVAQFEEEWEKFSKNYPLYSTAKYNNNKQAWKKIPGFVVIYRHKSQKLTLIFIKFYVLCFIFYVKYYILSLHSILSILSSTRTLVFALCLVESIAYGKIDSL